MAHLIDKDALVAEIEKQKKSCERDGPYWCGRVNSYNDIISMLDTLEVKEAYMDLTSGIDDILEKNGINPNTTGAKIIKEAFYKAIDKRLTKAQKGE